MNAIQQLQQQRVLLQLEYQTEKEAYRRQTEERGVERLVKRGDAWYPLRIGRSYYNSLNQLCIEVFRTQDEEADCNFEFGRPVTFFLRKDDNGGTQQKFLKYFSFTGTVSYVDGDRMVVSVPTLRLSTCKAASSRLGCSCRSTRHRTR